MGKGIKRGFKPDMCNIVIHTKLALFMLLINLFLLSQCTAFRTLSSRVSKHIHELIEAAAIPQKMYVGEEVIHANVALSRFYENRVYRPAWSDKDVPLLQVDILIRAIREANQEGLRPEDYHLAKIEALLNEVKKNQKKKKKPDPRTLVDLDLLLTDSFLVYASHLLKGKVDPEKINAEWHTDPRKADLAQLLEKAIDSNKIEEALKSFIPSHPSYRKLRQALAFCRDIVSRGEWPVLPDSLRLQKGDQGDQVVLLCRKLIATGDLGVQKKRNEDVFDDELEQAVRRFQKRHGLGVDKVVEADTLAAMNVPVEKRVRQIELNMERWRWLPQDLGQRYILVNIANLELDVVDHFQSVMKMRAIVGMRHRRTPVFSAMMTSIVFNPYWHIPRRTAIRDILPLVRKDINYFDRQKIRVFQGLGDEIKEVNPKNINWESVKDENFSYIFRQEPGAGNPLGRVKFMFPNRFNVYLHDTPRRELFNESRRTFSSGCIRIEKPIELAGYFLRSNPGWTKERIIEEIFKGVEKTMYLQEALPVHLLYLTAWVEEDGAVQFRSDIYGRDRRLDEALHEKSPAYLK